MSFGKLVLAIIAALLLAPIVGGMLCAGGLATCGAMVSASKDQSSR